MDQHRAEVDRVAASVRGFYERGEKFRINHGSTNSTREGALGRDPGKTVDTSRLNNVLRVDTEARTALVEPNVPMDQLAEATLAHGLIPPVVMEFPGITVGGGYSGTSGESSSFKHGFFNETLNSVEMVLANGELTTCSPTQHPDLFHGAAGAMGTLGVTTLVEIQLRPAATYVETTYHPVTNTAVAIEKCRTLADPSNPTLDYIDGILFSPTSGVIVTGRLVSPPTPTHPIRRFSAPPDPWFAQHAATHATSPTPVTELIPLPEYLFRYDRGGFWVANAAFAYWRPFVPQNRTTQSFLDDFLHTRMLYKALHASGQSTRMLVQDLALPYETAQRFIEASTAATAIWPLWLCPLKHPRAPTMHPHSTLAGEPPQQLLNIGLWGSVPAGADAGAVNRDVEASLRACGGMKWLYAQVFHASAHDFWQDFDESWYRALRRKWGAEGVLADVWEKVRGRGGGGVGGSGGRKGWFGGWPWEGVRGLRAAIRSREYLKGREREWKKWVPR